MMDTKKQPDQCPAAGCGSCGAKASCAGALEDDARTREILKRAGALLAPLLPANAQEAEVIVSAPKDGSPEIEGTCMAGEETAQLDLGPARAQLSELFADYPAHLLAVGRGPTNVYILSLERGEPPVLVATYDMRFGGRMSVQDICADFEAILTCALPEEWSIAMLQLSLDPNGETEISAVCECAGEEYDLTDELEEAYDRLEALFGELRLSPDVPKDGWNVAEFTLRPDGDGDLELFAQHEADHGAERE